MSLSNKRLNYFKKDEKKAVEEYEEAAKLVASEASKELFLAMAKDEARHAMTIDLIKEHEKDPKKKSLIDRLTGKSPEETVKKRFKAEGVYQEQGAEESVSEARPELSEENESENEDD